MSQNGYKAIVMGASAGGLAALSEILPRLPKGFPLGVTVVQHVHPSQGMIWTARIERACPLPLVMAEDKSPVVPGRVHFAPPGYHLLVERDETFSLSIDEKVNFNRPSIDVLFESAAVVWRSRLVGVILTGSNADGADGLRLVKEAGGMAVVQDPLTADRREMPEAAIAATGVDHVASPEEIGILLARLGEERP